MHCWWEGKQCNHYGKQAVGSSKVNSYHMNGSSTPSCIPKENWNLCPHKNITSLLIIAIKYKQFKYLLIDEWINKFGISIQWNIILPRKEMKNWCMLHQRWNLKILFYVKETRYQRPHTALCLFLWNVQNREKFI